MRSSDRDRKAKRSQVTSPIYCDAGWYCSFGADGVLRSALAADQVGDSPFAGRSRRGSPQDRRHQMLQQLYVRSPAAGRRGPHRGQRPQGGGKQPAPLESLAKHLRSAASVWGQVKGMHDDRLGPLSDFGDRLGALADDAERRLVALRQLKPAKPVDVRKQLICSLAKSCRDLGLRPTRSGRTYEESAPTWFQQFVGTLNDNLLGAQGWGAPDTYTRSALFAEVARAMRGDGK